MRIDCYRNLNAAKRDMARFIWSLRLDDKVDSHQTHMYLEGVHLRVQPAGLVKVRDNDRRTVYAYLRAAEYYLPADLDAASGDPTVDSLRADGYRPLTCNPHKEGAFVWADAPIAGRTAVVSGGQTRGETYTPRRAAPLSLTAVWLTPFGAFGLE